MPCRNRWSSRSAARRASASTFASLAATNKDLPTEIRASRFREDLYFRLNVIPVFVPPLRDRVDDIPRLAEHFMSELAREYGRRRKTFDPMAMSVLQRYRWPGNVREMRNVLERLMIMVPGDTIAPSDLSFLEGGAGIDIAPERCRCHCMTRATFSSATTSSRPWPASTAISHAPLTSLASNAAISTGRCAASVSRRSGVSTKKRSLTRPSSSFFSSICASPNRSSCR